MCANYKALPTVEYPDFQDQFTFFDDEMDLFPTDESSSSSPDCFDKIRDYLDKINDIINDCNMEHHEYDLTSYLKPLAEIFENDFNENIDDFLKETNIVEILCNILDFEFERIIDSENSIYVLNILAHIAKLSPQSMEKVIALITENSKVIPNTKYPTNYLELSLLFDVLRYTNLSPRIFTILFFSIDGDPSAVVENLVLNADMISRLASIALKLKQSGIENTIFISPLTTLISVLFNFISIDKVCQQDEKGDITIVFNRIIFNFEGDKQISFPIEEREYKSIIKIQENLLYLIRMIPNEVNNKRYSQVKVDNLSPLLDILARYLDCFATKSNLIDIIKDVEETLYGFFMNPRNVDQSGKIFNQVLTIYDKILRIDPTYFKYEFIDKIFEIIYEYDEDRLDILFFLSNIVKFERFTNYILTKGLLIQPIILDGKNYCFLDIINDMTYNEKENAIISLLTIMLYKPMELFDQIKENYFFNIIYDSIEITYTATNNYFVKMFLSSLHALLKDFPKLLENIDADSISECLISISEDNEEPGVMEFAQFLTKEYFSDNSE